MMCADMQYAGHACCMQVLLCMSFDNLEEING